MKKIVYTGDKPEVRILGIGDFKRNEIVEISEKKAERLLKIKGFSEVKKNKGGKK